MVYRLIRNLFLLLIATAPLVSAQVYNQFPPPGMAYTNHTAATSIVAGGAFNATGTTIPANGIYLPSANTLGFSTNSIASASINSFGQWNILAGSGNPLLTVNGQSNFISAGQIATFTTTVARGSGSSYFVLNDPTGRKMYFGYGNSTNDDFQFFNYLNTAIQFYTNGVQRFVIANTGNVTINTPVSGTALTVNGFGSVAPIYTNTGPQGFMIEGSDGTNSGAFLGFDIYHNMQMGSVSASYGLALYAGANKLVVNNTNVNLLTNLNLNGKLLVATAAPTISSGFGTSPSVVSNNGPSSFAINVGTGGTASTGTIGLPTAAHGWACSVQEVTSPGTDWTRQTGSTVSSVSVTNYSAAGGGTHAWTASDVLEISCWPN